MKINFLFKIVLLLFIPKVIYAIDPPVIIASGNQIYCPSTSLKIVETITITNDPLEPSTDAIYIQISSAYVNGQDLLTLTGIHPNITSSWDISAGKLKLFSPTGVKVTYSDFVNAIKDVEFNNFSTSPSGIREFSISIGQANYLPSTGHYYQFISNLGISWADAKIAAEMSTYFGISGYLVTITSMEEAQIAGAQASGAGWIGGSDAANEGEWKWVTGPENGTVFWNGAVNGSTPNFAFWNLNEPNNIGNENYAHITAPGVGIPGAWNDLQLNGDLSGNYQPKGFIVEYGGMPGDPILQISTSTKIIIAQITGVTSAERCDSGIVTLSANSSVGIVNWYDSATGINLLYTGNDFTTPFLNASTTYFVDSGCSSTRTPIIATINTIPTISSTNTPVSRCGSGTVTLQANSSIGTVNWYKTATGGNIEATGTNFTTPNITTSTTYYAEAFNNGCSNGIRFPVEVLVYTYPIVVDEEIVLCELGNVTLDALLPNQSYMWSTGEKSQKITVATPGTYTVEITSLSPENCTSTKKITVVEHNIPEIDRIEVNETTAVIYLKNEESYFEYSVDGINYQNSNVFNNLSSGLQVAYVREINLCSLDNQDFIILVVPKFFTPNNDSYNDLWHIKGLLYYPESLVTIFDRYGKFLKQLFATSLGWNGKYDGNELPATDYWYVYKIDKNSSEVSGHFTLKR